MARTYGIDLGAHTVKLAELEGSFGRYQVEGYHERRVPEPEERASSLDERLAVLESLLGDIGVVEGATYSVGFPTEQASVRLVQLPFGDRAKVEQALPFEVEGLVPFDLDDMVLSSRVIEMDPGQARVLVGLAERTRIRALLDGLSSVAVNPKVVVLDADLLGRHAREGMQAVVDVGHTRTLVALCQDGQVVSARALNSGGRALTLSLAAALDVDFATAEAHKHAGGVYSGDAPAAATVSDDGSDDVGLDEIDLDSWADEETGSVADPTMAPVPLASAPRALTGANTDVNRILRDAILPLLLEVRTTLIHFEDAHGVEIGEVVLAGGGAELGGLREWLGSLLGVAVRRATVSPEADGIPGAARFALADTVARKAAGEKGRLLDLRLGEFTFKGDLQVVATALRWGAAAAAVMLVCGAGWFGYEAYSLNAEVSALETQIADVVVDTFPDVSRSRVEGSTSTAMAIMQEKTTETTAQVDVFH